MFTSKNAFLRNPSSFIVIIAPMPILSINVYICNLSKLVALIGVGTGPCGKTHKKIPTKSHDTAPLTAKDKYLRRVIY